MRRLLVCSAISTAMLGARAPGITAQDADVSPKGSPIAEPPNGTNLGVIFGITNLTTSSHRFFLQCARTGFVTGCSGPANISIPGNGYTQITVTFSTGASGTGTLVERVSDAAGEDSGSYVVSLAQAKVAVTPDSASLAVPDQTTGLTLGYLFTVANTGNTPGIINLTLPTCQLPATGCTLTRTSLSLGVDASDTVRVKFNTGAAGPGGQIRLRGTVGSLQDDGWVNVAAYVQAPLQATAIAGPGVERSLCVAISAGPGVASECGDLRIVHPLPRLTTRTRLRAPALLYNSQTAHPYVVIADTVGLRTTDQVPTTVQAALTLNGVLLPTQTWTGANWSPGATRRIAVGLDGITYSTGSYSYSLALQKLVNGTLVPIRTDTGHVLIANRSTSPFRPGWWLAGLDQLLAQPDGSKLFVGGDGSTRIYYPVAGRSDLWSAPQATRQDVIQKAGGYFVQLLPDGVKVLFDTVKLVHRRTVNRLGDTTYFTWSDSSCQHLNSITVPLGPSPTYQFHYSGAGCPTLTSVVQATGGLTRTTMVALEADGVTLRVTDPDSTFVRYAYSSAAGHQNQILTRYNRLNDTTAYVYDVAYQLSQVIAKMRGATALTTRFVNLATKG